jgi:hypothetical protein
VLEKLGLEVDRSIGKLKMTVYWVLAPCCLIEVYRCFGGTCYLHHQGTAAARKTANFILAAVRTRNLTLLVGYLMKFYQLHLLYSVELFHDY